MCTRFYADIDKELKPLIDEAQSASFARQMMISLSRPLTMSGEIRPTDIAAVIARSKSGNRAVFPMQWGFHVKGLGSPVINVRLESAAEKPTFRDSWYRRRCIIPASWYFEWKHYTSPGGRRRAGEKYAIQPENSEITWLAGLYRFEDINGFRCPVFAVLTRGSAGAVKDIHDRMPLILPESEIGKWLSAQGDPQAVAGKALTYMAAERADDRRADVF